MKLTAEYEVPHWVLEMDCVSRLNSIPIKHLKRDLKKKN